MKHQLATAALLGFAMSSAAFAGPAAPVKIKETAPGLLAKAGFPAEKAIQSVQARYPKGKITEAEIEMEKGKLIYSFDVKLKGKTGIDEVNIDAHDGTLVNIEHETPADIAKDAAEDAKKAASDKKVAKEAKEESKEEAKEKK